jgi:type IV pilus assembly protein PilF
MNMKKLAVILFGLIAGCWQFQSWAEPPRNQAQSRAQVHTELGAAYYSRGQLAVALEELKAAVNSDARYAPAYNMLGLVYMELLEFSQAEESFQRAFSLDENNPEFHNNYGWFLCQRGRADDAIKHFFTALKNPLYATPEKSYVNAGVCSIKKGDVEGAETFFLKVLKLRAQEPQALYYLSELAGKRKDYFEAKNYLAQLLQTVAPGPEILWLAVRIERQLGNREAEAGYGAQLRKHFPDSREALALRSSQYDYSEFAKLNGQKVTK